jgi:hypothetical protein
MVIAARTSPPKFNDENIGGGCLLSETVGMSSKSVGWLTKIIELA